MVTIDGYCDKVKAYLKFCGDNIYELDSLDCLADLADPETMRPEARDELARWMDYGAPLVDNMSWNVYRPIAKHWRLAD